MSRLTICSCLAAVITVAVLSHDSGAQAARKRLLVIGDEKGYRHEAVTRAMVTIERLGRDSGLWETVIRTDRPDMQSMMTGAISWALRLVDADITPRPALHGYGVTFLPVGDEHELVGSPTQMAIFTR